MFFALLLLKASAVLFESFDAMLDPVDIFWPNNWVSNIIDLSSNHQGDSAVITLICNIPKHLFADTYVELDLGFSEMYSTILESDQASDKDNFFRFYVDSLPNMGTYGPVSLVIRQSVKGQILASKVSLGFIAILSAAPIGVSNSLIVTYTSNSLVASEPASLNFRFILTGSLNPGDYFFLSFDRSFGVRYLLLTWDDSEVSTGTPYFKDSDFEEVKSSDNTLIGIYIYGIQNVVPQNVVVSFTLSGFKNPPYAKTGGNYSWKIEVYRFGTSTMLQKYVGFTPLESIIPGIVTIISWSPTNGRVGLDKIAKCSVLYMTLVFSITHSIESGGIITIKFTEVSVNDIAYNPPANQMLTTNSGDYPMFINNDQLEYIICVITSSTSVTCIVNPGKTFPAGSKLNVYTLTHFSCSTSRATVSNIITSYNSVILDSLDAIESLILQDSSVSYLLNEPTTFITPLSTDILSTPVNSAGNYGTYGLFLDFVLPVELLPNQLISVKLPIKNTSTAYDFGIAFGTSHQLIYPIIPLYSPNYDWSIWGLLTSSLSMVSIKEGEILINVDCYHQAFMHLNYMIVSELTYLTAGQIKMPNFQTNKFSMHEITISFTQSNVFYYFSKPFYFRKFPTVVNFTPACLVSRLPGAIATISWTTFAYTPVSGFQAYVDFKMTTDDTNINGDFGSGLDSGSVYPCKGINNGDTFTIKYDSVDTTAHTTHLILTYGSSINYYTSYISFPFVELSDGKSYNLIATLYSMRLSDGAIFELSEAYTNQIIGISTAMHISDIVYSSDTTRTQSSSTALENFQFTYYFPNYSSFVIGLSFDYGFFLSSTSTLKLEGTSQVAAATNLNVISSEDISFKFLAAETYQATYNEETKFIITGLTVPWFEKVSSYIYLYSYNTQGTCTNHIGVPIVTQTGSSAIIKSVYLTPLEAIGLGASKQTIDLSLNFILPGPVYPLPDISFKILIGTEYLGKVDGLQWTLSADSYYNAQGKISDNGFDTIIDSIDDGINTGKITKLIPENTIVTISVFNIPLPKITTSNTIIAGFHSVLVKSSIGNIYKFFDSLDGADGLTRTNYDIGTAPSDFDIIFINVFPNAQGSIAAQFEIQFIINQDLPPNTVLEIKGETFLIDNFADVNTWCTHGFKSSVVSNGNLVITLNQLISYGSRVTIRKDLAFTIGSSSLVSPSFTLKATYGQTILLENQGTDNVIFYNEMPSKNIYDASITIEYTNKGISSLHTFKLNLNIKTDENWIFCFEAPGEYDAHPGPYMHYNAEPDVSFYMVTSSLSNNAYCYGEHWMIKCTGIGIVDKRDTIDFSIKLNNPRATTTYWNIYIIDSLANLVTQPKYDIIAEYTNIPDNNIDIFYVNHVSKLKGVSDISISSLISETFLEDSKILVSFPYPYQLNVYNSESVFCSAREEISYDSYNDLVYDGSKCLVDDNFVVFDILNSMTLNRNYWTTFKMYDIIEPQFGLQRIDDYWDNHNTDLFEVYDFWTGKFILISVKPYSSVSFNIASISYNNLNAAYTGYYYSSFKHFVINNGNDITVRQGVFSNEFVINTYDNVLWANSVELVAKDENNGILAFSKNGRYILTFDFPKTQFRVGAPSKTSNGIYYITWLINEDSFLEGKRYYGNQPKTRVQIYSDKKIKLEIDGSLNAVPGFSTMPIKISLNGYSPFINLYVKCKLESESTMIKFVPKTVTFTNIDTIKYFYINVREGAYQGTYIFNCLLSGINDESFEIKNLLSFNVELIQVNEMSLSVSLDILSQTQADLRVEIESKSIIYWALVSSSLYRTDNNTASLETIKLYAKPLFEDPNYYQKSIIDQFSDWADRKSAIEIGDDWSNYTYKLLDLAKKLSFYGISFAYSGSTIIQSFDNLIANSEFTAVVYAEFLSTNITKRGKDNKFTEALLSPCMLKLDFPEHLKIYPTSIKEAVAIAIGVPIIRIIDFKGFLRRLDNSASNLILPSATSSISPLDMVSRIKESSLRNSIAYEGILPFFSLAITEIIPGLFPDPSFIESVIYNEKSFVYFNFTISNDGYVSCTEEYDPDLSLNQTSYNVFLGYDRKSEKISSHVIKFYSIGDSDSWIWHFDENKDYGDFVFTCTVCNNYPILPKCLDQTKMISFSFLWANEISFSDMNFIVGLASILMTCLV